MTRSSILVVGASFAAILLACSDAAIGHCSGVLASVKFDADIDPESEHHIVQRQVCSQTANKTRWILSYGEGALQITALSPEMATGALSEQTLRLPPNGDWFEEWTIVAPAAAASLTGGTMTLPASYLDLAHRLKGSFRMGLTDGSLLDCSFELPKAADEGKKIDCPVIRTTTTE